MQVLQGVLNMRRLQTLEQLTLDFQQIYISWQDLIHFLQVIPPSVRKLYLECLSLMGPLPPIRVLAEELVAKLVQFEEVHLDFNNDMVPTLDAILRAVATVGSSGKASKLKILSIPGCCSILLADALTEARKVLTVNLI